MAETASSDTNDLRRESDIQDPPRSPFTILKKIGPGLIIAANIVGSGELIMATKTGAAAGIGLLWLIIIGCVIKVFVQLELGRFAISHGETTLTALSRVPGPRVLRVNWVVVLWAMMMFFATGQLGGIVGSVGQALAVTVPITEDFQKFVKTPDSQELITLATAENGKLPLNLTDEQRERRQRQAEWLRSEVDALENGDELFERASAVVAAPERSEERKAAMLALDELTHVTTWDDRIWVSIVGVLTAFVLYNGRYRLIERVSVVLVVMFSLVTMGNVIALQQTTYAVSADQFLRGLSFGIPPGGLTVALATFGIIGVGATELVSYPYWCLEKGYARSCGPRDSSDAWISRAFGWIRVMKFDAFASMVIYTIATAAFFLMGVAVLHSDGRDPAKHRLVTTLAESYVPVFGDSARLLFLFGAIAVLYSTYLVANASNARMMADFTSVIGLSSRDPDSAQRKTIVRVLSFILPLLCVLVYFVFTAPVKLIMLSGIFQGAMLPVLAFSSLYFRYHETDERLRPSLVWDASLVLSSVALAITGAWGIYSAVEGAMKAAG